jgi:hypothetical protein
MRRIGIGIRRQVLDPLKMKPICEALDLHVYLWGVREMILGLYMDWKRNNGHR